MDNPTSCLYWLFKFLADGRAPCCVLTGALLMYSVFLFPVSTGANGAWDEYFSARYGGGFLVTTVTNSAVLNDRFSTTMFPSHIRVYRKGYGANVVPNISKGCATT